MKVLVNFALVLVMILCFVNIASSHHAQGNVPRNEAPLHAMASEAPIVPVEATVAPVEATVAPVEATVAPVEATVAPVESVTIPASPKAQETQGYFALLLDQLKSFFIPETHNATAAAPEAPAVEQVVLA